jgi:hypothetical protein
VWDPDFFSKSLNRSLSVFKLKAFSSSVKINHRSFYSPLPEYPAACRIEADLSAYVVWRRFRFSGAEGMIGLRSQLRPDKKARWTAPKLDKSKAGSDISSLSTLDMFYLVPYLLFKRYFVISQSSPIRTISEPVLCAEYKAVVSYRFYSQWLRLFSCLYPIVRCRFIIQNIDLPISVNSFISLFFDP